MKILKKCVIILLFAIAILATYTINSNASSSELFLNNLDFYVKINQDGSMDVTETWDIDIEETNTLFKTFNIDKTKYSSISNVQVSDITDGININFEEIEKEMYHATKNCYYGLINSKGKFEIAWGVGLDYSRARKKYKIQYRVQDAIAKYNDYAELYWQFVGENFEIDAKKVTGTIILPQKAYSKENIKVWGHTEDLNGEIYVTDLNKIEFEVTNFNSGRYIEIRTLFPTEMIEFSERQYEKEILNSVIEEETKWANEANLRREIKKQFKVITIIVVDIICILICYFMFKKLKKTLENTKEFRKFKPTQELQYFRDIPREDATPAQAVFVKMKQVKGNFMPLLGQTFSATLLDLCLKKYISFEMIENNSKNVNIELLENDKDKLSKDERVILEFLEKTSKNKDKITIKELEKYIKNKPSAVEKLRKNIENYTKEELKEKGIYDSEQEKLYTKYNDQSTVYLILIFFILFFGIPAIIMFSKAILIGIVPLLIMAIAGNVISSKVVKNINVYTQQGVDENEEWKALQKFMMEFSMLDKKKLPELVIWEKFLVYATAFGIASVVLKQLKIAYPNLNETLDVNTYMYLMTQTDFASSFTKSINSSISSASSAYSSGSGGGGGFSGRRRRWPEVGGGGGGR